MGEKIKLDISATSILKIIAVLGIIYLLYVIRDVLLLILIAAILVAAFGPIINKWSKKIGKPLSITLIVLILISAVAGFVYLIIPPFVSQTKQLSGIIPDLINRSTFLSSHLPTFEQNLSAVTQGLGGITGGFITLTTSVVNGIFAVLTVLVLTIYFLIDEQVFVRFVSTVVPDEKQAAFAELFSKISTKIGEWLRGQLLLGLIIGVVSYIGLAIIGVKYALALGVISGVLEIVPILGPIIAGALAALISLSISPVSALIIVIFYVLLHQLENSILVPKIMAKAVGLPPAIIIIAILIGGKLLGVVGALLAVPISGIIYVIFQEWKTVKKITSIE